MTQTIAENVFIDGSQDTEQLRVQGHTTQNDPLQTWENSAGDVLGQVTGDGRILIGDDLGGATPDSFIEAHRDSTSIAKPKRGIHSLGKITNLLSDIVAWVVAEVEFLGSAGVSGLQAAIRAKATHNNTGTSTNAEIRAGDFEAVNQTGTSGSRVGQVTGVRGTASNTPSGSNAYLSKAVGVEAHLANAEDGDISDAVGFEVAPPTNDGTIANLYGLRIPDLTEGTSNYAIHTGEGLVHFGDHQELKVLASTPIDNPSADFIKVYPKLDEGMPQLYAKDSDGVETQLGGAGGGGASIPVGIIWTYGGSSAPSGWLFCDGAALSRATYADLYAVLGDLYNSLSTLSVLTSSSQADLDFGSSAHGLTVGAATLDLSWILQANISSINISTDVITTTANHGFATGDRVQVTTTGTLPGGISANTDYWVRNLSATTFTLHTSQAGASANTGRVNITSAGTNTRTVVSQDGQSRNGVSISSVASNLVTVTGGTGDNLPPVSTLIEVECATDLFFKPDLRGRVPMGVGQGLTLTNRLLGQKVGAETHVLTVNEMPSHAHTIGNPSPNYSGGANSPLVAGAGLTGFAGGNVAHNNVQPSLPVNFIIKT